ncbi:Uncharacterized protein APZ42_022778 [Daphnia magna]|uniref:Uncharacterized protein n=1 Tax=Daphnia magna TaxID=35525 RepID=A0A164VRV8_9CRUS|nr:Uncharacterized protein APZ42_022778 [Daphnia magna]
MLGRVIKFCGRKGVSLEIRADNSNNMAIDRRLEKRTKQKKNDEKEDADNDIMPPFWQMCHCY